MAQLGDVDITIAGGSDHVPANAGDPLLPGIGLRGRIPSL